jgi:hypothetical protein
MKNKSKSILIKHKLTNSKISDKNGNGLTYTSMMKLIAKEGKYKFVNKEEDEVLNNSYNDSSVSSYYIHSSYTINKFLQGKDSKKQNNNKKEGDWFLEYEEFLKDFNPKNLAKDEYNDYSQEEIETILSEDNKQQDIKNDDSFGEIIEFDYCKHQERGLSEKNLIIIELGGYIKKLLKNPEENKWSNKIEIQTAISILKDRHNLTEECFKNIFGVAFEQYEEKKSKNKCSKILSDISSSINRGDSRKL